MYINQIEPNLNAVMTGDGPVVDTRHKYPEAVLEASADHEAEVVVGTEVKGNLQRAVSQSWTRRYNLRLLQPQKSLGEQR